MSFSVSSIVSLLINVIKSICEACYFMLFGVLEINGISIPFINIIGVSFSLLLTMFLVKKFVPFF